MATLFNQLNDSIKNWWLSILIGVVFLIVGIWVLFVPAEGYIALSIIFSITVLLTGIVEIIFATSNRHVSSWGWYLAGGIIDLIIGIILIATPTLTMEVIPFIISFWLMFRGFSSIGYSMDLKRYGTNEWGWYLAFGILAVICSLIILWQPAIGAIYAVYMISFTFLVVGFFRIMLGIEMKSLHKRGKEVK